MFICRVQNAGLGGIEGFVPTDAGYKLLDSTIASVGRLAMQGRACEKKTVEDGEVVRTAPARQPRVCLIHLGACA